MSLATRERSAVAVAELAIRSVVGGILAGAAFLAVNMWFATSMGDPAKGPLLMMSTIVKGDEAMMTGAASVGVGVVVHAVLSILFAIGFAVVAFVVRGNGPLAVAGIAYGALLYLINFKVLTPLAFETFKMANQPFELVAHIMFGALLSVAFFSLPAREEAAFATVRSRGEGIPAPSTS